MVDFKRFPELTNSQMELYYFESPHRQITEDFYATVVKVIDGDTIRVKWEDRDFDFPVRLLGTDAPELNEGGRESKAFLEQLILKEFIKIEINRNQRVGKFGRLLGTIIHDGINVNELTITQGFATPFGEREADQLPDLNIILEVGKWL